MKMRIIYNLIFISVFFLASCSTQRMFTTLDILRPAEVSFSPTVQNVLIVNNASIQPYNLGHYDYSSFSDWETPKQVSLKFDSAAVFTTASLRENLEDKGFFGSVSMSDTKVNTSDNFYKVLPLTKTTVRFLCNLYDVEAVISLDHILLTDRMIAPGPNLSGVVDVLVESKWSIHYPNDTVATSKDFTDEFSWEEAKSSDLPSRYNALVDACILAGSNIADRMIPRWEKQDRYYYTPKSPAYMKDAMTSISQRKWEEAISHWDKADNKEGYKTRYYAANNKAITYEIMGDIDKAIDNTVKAIEYYQNIVFVAPSQDEILSLVDYYRYLKNRKDELILINKQLGK